MIVDFSKLNILVTGPTGFVGKSLIKRIDPSNLHLITRNKTDLKARKTKIIDIGPKTNYEDIIKGIDVVVHIAAKVHSLTDTLKNEDEEYQKINHLGTANLAYQAKKAGVKKFIYISTIKVNGEFTSKGKPFKYNDKPQPVDSYSKSKFYGEKKLKEICKDGSMSYVILRPPLIYGTDAKANFASLFNLAKLPIPLPFGGINNLRGFIFIENFIDLMIVCITNPKANNQTLLASDGKDISVSDLITKIRKSYGMKSRLFSFPINYLSILSNYHRLSSLKKLIQDLEIDIEHTENLLDWSPKVPMEVALLDMVNEDN